MNKDLIIKIAYVFTVEKYQKFKSIDKCQSRKIRNAFSGGLVLQTNIMKEDDLFIRFTDESKIDVWRGNQDLIPLNPW